VELGVEVVAVEAEAVETAVIVMVEVTPALVAEGRVLAAAAILDPHLMVGLLAAQVIISIHGVVEHLLMDTHHHLDQDP
jgi:hypothetical protein